MSVFDIVATTLIAFMGGIVIGLMLLLLRNANVTSRPLRALRRRLLGRSWQPVLLEPVEITPGDLRGRPRKAPSTATR